MCISLSSTRARFFFLFFFRDVSNSVPLLFTYEEFSSLSFRSRNNKNAIHPIHRRRRGTHSLSLSLSLFLSLSSFVESVLFRLSLPFSLSCFLLPLESRSPRDDDFCDYIFGYLFGLITRKRENFCVVVNFIISFLSLSCVRIPASNVCE